MLATGLGLIVLDGTIVGVALPSIIADLNLDITDAQWVNSLYAVLLAALLPSTGKLADAVGRRRMFLLGLAVFAAGSGLAAAAGTAGTLIGSRAVQALGAAMIMPSTLSTVNAVFRGRHHAAAFGVWGAVISGAAARGGPVAYPPAHGAAGLHVRPRRIPGPPPFPGPRHLHGLVRADRAPALLRVHAPRLASGEEPLAHAEPLVRGLAEHPVAVAAANYVARPHAHHPGEPTAERFLEPDAFRSAVPAERVLQEQLRKASLPGVPARVLEVALILYMLVGALWGYVDANTTEDADFGFILSFLTVMFGSCGVIIVLMRRRRLLRTEPVHRFRAELPAAALPPEHVRTLALAATLASRSPADAWAGDPDLARNMGLTGEEEHLAAADKRRRRGERRGSRRAHASGATAPR